jgi:hypothetical protein
MTDHSFIHETRYAWFITGLMYLNRFAVSKIHRRLISAGNSFPNICEPSSCTGSESFQAVTKGFFFFFFFFARARHSGFRTARGGCQSLLLQLECQCLLSTVTAAANELKKRRPSFK